MRHLRWPTRPSQPGWALLLLAIFVAAFLRFWQLGDIPPGLYRDEAANGLDAVAVIENQRDGQSPFYFEANNGREPLFIYLVAASIRIFGRTAFAIRLVAAVLGTLTTWFTYKLAKAWFGHRVGLLAAWTWALTLWPVHLSRIGLRPILLPLLLTAALWLATLAYRKQESGWRSNMLWLVAGITYGLCFYTYLAARFSIVILILLAIYLFVTKRVKRFWPAIGLWVLGATIIVAPLVILAWRQPDLILGRSGQVSIFNPLINEGNFLGTFLSQFWAVIGMFGWQGDSIIRHNPPGRPLFDVAALFFFVAGLVWSIKEWRRTPAMLLLIWLVVMLGPTLFAEDAPHFLRVVGILPAATVVVAVGLSWFWEWKRLPVYVGPLVVILSLAASLVLTVKDYFYEYGRQPETAYWFEAGARDLAESVLNDEADVQMFIDRRFRDNWPVIPYLLGDSDRANYYDVTDLEASEFGPGNTIFAWPYERLDLVSESISSPALVQGSTGSLAQGDLEPEPYPLFIKYTIDVAPRLPTLAIFDDSIKLLKSQVTQIDDQTLQVDLYWTSSIIVDRQLKSFVHLVSADGLTLGQDDSIPSGGNLPTEWWRPGLVVKDQHTIKVNEKLENLQPQIRVGLYNAYTQENLPVADVNGELVGESWLLRP